MSDSLRTDQDGIGKSLDQAFRAETEASVQRGVYLLALMAVILYPVFGILDLVRVPGEILSHVLEIRVVGWAVLFVILLIARYRGQWFRGEVLGAILGLSCAFPLVEMTTLFEAGSNPYYAGINLVIIGTIFIPWGTLPSGLVTFGIWWMYLVMNLLFAPPPPEAVSSFVSNNFFMGSTALMSTAINWYAHNLRFDGFRARFQQEKAFRELELATTMVRRKHDELEAKSLELTRKTEEVEQTNRTLADANLQLEGQRRELTRQSAEVEETNHTLADANQRLEVALGELAQNKEQLERAHADLAEKLQVKTRFLNTMTHELRTPLTCLLSPIQDLLAGNIRGKLREVLADSQSAGKQLLDLINDLLDVARYDKGEVPLRQEELELHSEVESMLLAYRPLMERKGLTWALEASPGLPPVWYDRRELTKVLRNLISNAIKFTEPGGRITVRLEHRGAQVEFSVEDTGPGIPPEIVPKLFSPFVMGDTSATRKHEGSGLGLALVRSIARRHRGDATLSSTVGVGTRVTVTMPLGVPPLEEQMQDVEGLPPETSSARPIILSESDMGQDSAQELPLHPMPLPELMEEMQPAPERPRVLVVEDNPLLQKTLVRLLENDYEITAADNGRIGLEAALANKPDLILSDVMMPEMSGLELLEAIRAHPGTRRLPFVLLTARADGPDRVSGLWSGASDYITKPFNPQELRARIYNLLRLRQFEHYITNLNQELLGRSDSLEGRLKRLMVNTIRTLVAAIDAKDYYTGGHSERVAFFSLAIARQLGMSEAELETLHLGALMHDVGKIGIPDRVLNKPGHLEEHEVEIIREHPKISGMILDRAPELAEMRLIAVHHHERWDGQGYPYGLKGSEIPYMARIVSLADCWDAMVSDRIYRDGMDPEIAMAKIRKLAGNQLDPETVAALDAVYRTLELPPSLRPLKPHRNNPSNREPQVGKVAGPAAPVNGVANGTPVLPKKSDSP